MELKINKEVTINFISLVENPEVLLQENIDWDKLKANEAVIDALGELSLAGCEISIDNNFDPDKVSDFYEENGIYELLHKFNTKSNKRSSK